MLFTCMLRMGVFHRATFLILPIFFILYSTPVCSQEDRPVSPSADEILEEELRYLKAETYVITASKVLENIKKSAASISVITDRQIRQMGARHLSDVLQIVPGMNYYYGFQGTHSIYSRGSASIFSQKILVMLNKPPFK